MLLGDLLRRRREEFGWGQHDLARRLQVTQQTVSRWEQGASLPRPRRLLEIADVLELDSGLLHRLAGYLPAEERSREWSVFQAAFEQVHELSDTELMLLMDRLWQEFRHRNGLGPNRGG